MTRAGGRVSATSVLLVNHGKEGRRQSGSVLAYQDKEVSKVDVPKAIAFERNRAGEGYVIEHIAEIASRGFPSLTF